MHRNPEQNGPMLHHSFQVYPSRPQFLIVPQWRLPALPKLPGSFVVSSASRSPLKTAVRSERPSPGRGRWHPPGVAPRPGPLDVSAASQGGTGSSQGVATWRMSFGQFHRTKKKWLKYVEIGSSNPKNQEGFQFSTNPSSPQGGCLIMLDVGVSDAFRAYETPATAAVEGGSSLVRFSIVKDEIYGINGGKPPINHPVGNLHYHTIKDQSIKQPFIQFMSCGPAFHGINENLRCSNFTKNRRAFPMMFHHVP